MNIKKNRILLTVMIAILLSVVAVFVVSAVASKTTVYPDTTSVSLFHSGKSSITLEIDKSQLEEGLREGRLLLISKATWTPLTSNPAIRTL